jgi:hypothetical protein
MLDESFIGLFIAVTDCKFILIRLLLVVKVIKKIVQDVISMVSVSKLL